MKKNNIRIYSRVLEEANQFRIYKDATVRSVAKKNNVSKSTVHKDLVERLPHIDSFAYDQVRAKLDLNSKERSIRGGEATRQKYLVKKKENSVHKV